MKLVYISRGVIIKRADVNSIGPEKKIQQQITNLNKLGVKVSQIYPRIYTTNLLLDFLLEKIITPIKYLNQRKLYDKDTVVYIRREHHHLSYLPLLLSPRLYKVVIETQTIERVEYRSTLSGPLTHILYSWYNYPNMLLFEKYIKSKADAIISVTNEIDKYNRALTRNKLQYLTLGNGIDTSQIKIRTFCEFPHQQLHMLFVGYVVPWHGIDRIILGMSKYNGSRDIYLHIVGEGLELQNLRKLVSTLHLEPRVIFHGFKSGTDLDAMFDQCHIAIGSLAGFRVNLIELSSLKSREYCARGIPFLMASKDADFPETWEYIQMVPADESPIDMKTVISFAERVMADPNHPQKMRRYAEDHLDWLAKMKVLKEFLETL